MEALRDSEIQQALRTLQEWSFDGKALLRTATFSSFLRGISFVNAVAHLAERQNHHPDIEIHYQQITLRYWTHVAKGVTQRDFEGAKEAESLITQFKKEPALNQT